MTRLDRYLLSQLLLLFGFFALVFVMVFWINRAVMLFDWLIADGQPFGVFLQFIALWLPAVIAMVLPLAAFAAAVYVTNRLANESELTVMLATGISPWRLAVPVAAFGLAVALMTAALAHFLVPAAAAELRQRQEEVSRDYGARLLREGTFLHPARGVTFFIGEITPEGELRDVFLSDRRSDKRDVIYTASEAYVVETDAGPRLVLVGGLAQVLDLQTRRLSKTRFRDFGYDISGLIQPPELRPRLRELDTLTLLSDPAGVAQQLKVKVGEVLEEAHQRINLSVQALAATLIGFATLVAGAFSRFGAWRQIVLAIFLLAFVKLIESATTDAVRGAPELWPLVYVNGLAGLGFAVVALWLAARPRRPRRRAGADAAEVPA